MTEHYKVYTTKNVRKKARLFIFRPIFIENASPIKCYLYRLIERKLFYPLYIWLSAESPLLNEMRGRYFHIF